MRIGIMLSIGAWVACMGLAAMPVVRHQYSCGLATDAGSWPSGSMLARARDGWTLVMVVHARCPCAQASLGELAQVEARAPALHSIVMVVTPPGVGGDDALARRAGRIPGVTVVADDGTEAARFGVSTSGHTLLFNPAGHLAFSGGITASRGHLGGNAGEDAVIALALGQPTARTSAPVFGCPLTASAPDTCPRCHRPEAP